MSVLIEAMSLVVPRVRLESHYPGGTDGWLEELSRPSSESRFVCADSHLVSASFFTPDAAERAAALLISAGMLDEHDDQYNDFAVVDQKHGPLLQCSWLMWTIDESGYTCAWLAFADRGELAAPEGWTVANSRRLTRIDPPALSSEVIQLADENGVITWLDFRTGRIVSSSTSP